MNKLCKFFLFLATVVVAQSAWGVDISKQATKNKPIYIEANQLYYDRNNDIVFGEGQVEITQESEVIVADKIVYYRSKDEIYALGNASYLMSDGSTYFGDKILFNNLEDRGAILNFKGRFQGNSTIAANYAEMISRDVIVAKEGAYTPCSICDTNFFPNTPLWQFRANQATINQQDQEIIYDGVTLEMFGMPVMYSPYAKTPTPGADRKTGLLLPRAYLSEDFGGGVRVPLYLNLARNMDSTLGMRVNEKLGNVYDGEFRHKLVNGEYFVFGSFTHTDAYDKQGKRIKNKQEYRAHYELDGHYKMANYSFPSTLFVQSKKLHDPTKTYLKKYKFGNEDILKSDAQYISEGEHLRTSVRALHFQDLRPNSSSKTTAAALPNISMEYDNKIPSLLNSDLNVQGHYTGIVRAQGTNYQRFVGITSLSRKQLLPKGVFWRNSASMRADHYVVNRKPVFVTSSYTPRAGVKHGEESRYHPELESELSWPLHGLIGSNYVNVEPLVQGIISPRLSNKSVFDNEDSQSPELSASNLFLANRYKGLDLLENGNRLNYGLRSVVKNPYIENISLTLGQMIRSSRDPNLDNSSGMSGYRSDYVSKILISPTKFLTLANSTRFDKENGRVHKNEFGFIFNNNDNFNFGTYHYKVSQKMHETTSTSPYRQEIIINSGYKFYRDWWVEGFAISKLGKENHGHTRLISDGIKLKNINDCLHFELTLERDHTRLKDLRPSTTYAVTVSVPTF